MASIPTAWTDPTLALASGGLDVATDDTLPESYFDAVAGNLTVLGGKVVSKTGVYTATDADGVILASASGGVWTLSLPTAVGRSGKRLIVVKTDSSANAVTLAPSGTETINGSATLALASQYATAALIADGANWVNTSGRLTTASAALAADVVLTLANTYYDGPSVSLGAGTWLISARVTCDDTGITGGEVSFTAKLWDGTTVWASGGDSHGISPSQAHVAISAIVTVAATTTVKVSVASNVGTNSRIRAAAPINGAGNNASMINAVRVQ